MLKQLLKEGANLILTQNSQAAKKNRDEKTKLGHWVQEVLRPPWKKMRLQKTILRAFYLEGTDKVDMPRKTSAV